MAKYEESERFTGTAFEEWESSLSNLADSTQRVYKREMLRFLEFHDTDTETLYHEQLENLKISHPANMNESWFDARAKKRMGKKAEQLMKHLESEGKAANTVMQVYKALKSFFDANVLEFELNGYKPNIRRTKGKDRITVEQIKVLLENTAFMRNKAIITTLKDTGLRISDVVNITFENIRPILDDPEKQYHTFEIEVSKTTNKTGILANPCIGPDAVRYLKMWIDERRNLVRLEDFDDPEGSPLTENDDDFIFIKMENRRRYKTRVGDQLDSNTISPLFTRLIRRSGFEDANISAHSFRKYFETKMQVAGIPDQIIDKYTGRAAGYKGVYVKPNENELLEYFVKAYPYLSIVGKLEHLNGFRTEIEDLKETLTYTERVGESFREELSAKDDVIEDQQKQINQLKEQFAKMMGILEKQNGDLQ